MRRRPILFLLLAGLTASACGGSGDDAFDIGIKRIALGLAFSEEDLAEPVEPKVIIKVIPAPEGTNAGNLDDFRTPEVPLPPIAPPTTCAKAPDGAAPADVVSFEVSKPPTAGRYARHNTGSIVVTGGAFPLTLPFPPISSTEVGEPEEVLIPGPAGVGDPTTVTEFEVRKILSPTFQTIDRLRLVATVPTPQNLSPGRLQLVERTTINADETTVFTPTPVIDFYVFGTEGTTWSSAGVDLESGQSMLVQGDTIRREAVDVCGTVFDSYRVEVTENMVDLESGETSGTAQGEPDVYNIATHLGGLILREDVHQTIATTDPETSAPLLIDFDYVSTVDTVTATPIER